MLKTRTFLFPLVALTLLGLIAVLAERNIVAMRRIDDSLEERALLTSLTTVNAIRGVARYGPDKDERVEAVLEEVARTPGVVGVELVDAFGRSVLALGDASGDALRHEGMAEQAERFGHSIRFELQSAEPCCAHAECSVNVCHPPSQRFAPGEYSLWMCFDASTGLAQRRHLISESVILAVLFVLLTAISLGLFVSLRRNDRLSRRLAIDAQKRDSLERLGLLAGGLAHEIRNPLGAIRGLTQLLHERSPEGEDRENTALMLSELDRVGERLEEFLSFARKRRLERQPVDLRALLKDVITLLGPDAKAGKLDFILDAPESLCVEADPSQLKELFINLLLNALQACEHGGSRIRVALERSREQVEVRVEDDGHGIPAELLGRIFDPYFSTRTSGTGLGLAIARRISEDHGASLSAESEPGCGSRFRVLFDATHRREAENRPA